MSREKFQEVASSRSLDPATIDILIAEKYEDEDALSHMTPEQLKNLDITEAQRNIIEKWLTDLAVSKTNDVKVEELKVTIESAST